MAIRKRRGWELAESAATSETHYASRRRLLAGMGLGGLILAAPAVLRQAGLDAGDGPRSAPTGVAASEAYPTVGYPAPRNGRYAVDRPLTAEADATSFNNFYEFGSHKGIAGAAQGLPIRPWQVRIDGLV